ncbi:hypothetical protein MKS87_11390 [Bacillus subtilis]|uniref:hypothetical protein n=1 Tax=Bacillus subtilis TaxID=1423 RepID=UPI001B91B040|nr:hypothetical protein [Bacillus subtilis]UML50989.1 hypothetical protein MKS87_11390 [Bacillus subtilis]WVM73242.1 hypothetical protein V0Q53_05145 [Bacillus subtilis]CAF1821718.1 hypothetical protein NRS6085_04119 [Bacillus subtilis]CAI6276527.1 hypothetical protein NRS6085_11760 [Bacillus subtilis]
MSDKEYLLTYKKNGTTDFDWFDTEEEMRNFYEENKNIEIIDSIRIWNVQEIDLSK